MPKLKLVMDDLRVESFDTAGAAKEKGTVFGGQCSCQSNCDTCPGCPTCDATCANTCDDVSCAGTCAETLCGTCANSCYGTCGEFTCRPLCTELGTCWTCPPD